MPTEELILMAAIVKLYGIHDLCNNGKLDTFFNNLFSDVFQYFRLSSSCKETVQLQYNNYKYFLSMEIIEKMLIRSTMPSGKTCDASIVQINEKFLRVVINDEMHVIRYFVFENMISIWSKQLGKFIFTTEPPERNISSFREAKDVNGRIVSSMPCKITQIMVRTGERVKIGSPLCITEAMKMEVFNDIYNLGLLLLVNYKIELRRYCQVNTF